MTRLDRLASARQAHARVVEAREAALSERLDDGDLAMVLRAHPYLSIAGYLVDPRRLAPAYVARAAAVHGRGVGVAA